ncbi:MAG: hypothetical protein K8F91_07370 [Candidatus Obscuribacterales bacterium]|nr:hypothetical protein [Candidatus Obscuribacterales bacterium]
MSSTPFCFQLFPSAVDAIGEELAGAIAFDMSSHHNDIDFENIRILILLPTKIVKEGI